jgi:hypothetical protein
MQALVSVTTQPSPVITTQQLDLQNTLLLLLLLLLLFLSSFQTAVAMLS